MKIGVFDSGLGGLSILKEIRQVLPSYDYLYLGDNARAPYGTRSFDVIYEYTWQAVQYLIEQDCRLIILACNTASAKALRNIQQQNIDPKRVRVLGVIRPTVESIHSQHIGLLATTGTVNSDSYKIELNKIDPSIRLSQQACPLFVPLIENHEIDTPATQYFVDRYISELMEQDPEIETILLGCTHYPLLSHHINESLRQWCSLHQREQSPTVVAQGELVAHSLSDYLQRHPEIEHELDRNGQCIYLTTESEEKFQTTAKLFIGDDVYAQHIEL